MAAAEFDRAASLGERPLDRLAQEAAGQIAGKACDQTADPCLRWGIAFAGKHVAVACRRESRYEGVLQQ